MTTTIRNFALAVLTALVFAGCAQEPFDDSVLAGIWTRTNDDFQVDLRDDHFYADDGGVTGG